MSRRSFMVRALAGVAAMGTLLAMAGCAITPGMRPRYLRQVKPAERTFDSIVLVFMRLPPGPAATYTVRWGDVEGWRQPFFRRIEQNFASNGLRVKVFDAGVAGSTTIEPADLQVRLAAEGLAILANGYSYSMRVDASNRDTRYLTFSDDLYMRRFPDTEADRMTWLILNSLRDGGLIKPPADGDSYVLAP